MRRVRRVEWVKILAGLLLTTAMIFGVTVGHAEESDSISPTPMEGIDSVPQQSDPEKATSYIKSKQWDEAVTVLTKLQTRSGLSVRQTEDLARALFMVGKRTDALDQLNRVYERSGVSGRLAIRDRIGIISKSFLTHATSQTYLDGLSFLDAKKYKEAVEKFEKALRAESDNVEILIRWSQATLLNEGTDRRFAAAIEKLTFAQKLNPLEPEIKLWLGRARALAGESSAALTHLQEARRLLPRSELAVLWLAETQLALGQKNAAVQTLESAIFSQPFHLRAILDLAKIRSQGSQRDLNVLTGVRRDLQVALSRLNSYGSLEHTESGKFESDLGVDLRDASLLRSEIQNLFQKVEARIAQSEP